jgi:hypothetical protein
MPDIVSRSEAEARGLKQYFTGKPCMHGHVVERRCSNGECTVCHRERHREWHRAKYDRDPVWRITLLMKQARRGRAATVAAMHDRVEGVRESADPLEDSIVAALFGGRGAVSTPELVSRREPGAVVAVCRHLT